MEEGSTKNQVVEEKVRDQGLEEKWNCPKIHDTSTVTVPHITRANVKCICYPFDKKFFRNSHILYFLALNFLLLLLFC